MDILENAIIAAVVGGVSGSLVSFFSTKKANAVNRRAVRLESRFDSLDHSVESLRREISIYYSAGDRDASAETRILGFFEDISSKVDNLSGFGVDTASVSQAQRQVDRIYNLVTDSPFRSSNWFPRPEILEEVRKDCVAICRTFHPTRMKN